MSGASGSRPPSGWFRADGPPTVANVGPGFDCLGLAVPAAGDIAWVRRRQAPGLALTVHGDGGVLPTASDKNSASAAAADLLRRTGASGGLEVVLHKGLPTGGSGLGSSGASAAAAVAATAACLGDVDDDALWRAAAQGEEIACGAPHIDNVIPALHGGLLLMSGDGETLRLPVPDGLELAIARPFVDVPTAAARAVLPGQVPTATAIDQAMSLGALLHALHTGDLELLGRHLVDRIAAPARAHLLPAYDAVLSSARSAGALGASMSGSGPAVFALCRPGRAARTAQAMVDTWTAAGVEAEVFHAGAPCGRGAIASVRLDAPPGSG